MRAFVILRLALRSVGRNARRSVLTAAAMVLGLALLIFSRSLADGGHEQWIDSAVTLGAGHVAIQAPGYLESASLDHRLDAASVDRAVAAVRATLGAELAAVAPRLAVEGLASAPASALPVRIEGVDPELEVAFSNMPSRLTEGRYLAPDDRLSAFVGVELARRLDLEVGSRFVLTAQSSAGDIQGQLVRVTGLFRTGIPEVDEGLVHIPIETARTWLGTPGEATTVALLLSSSRFSDAAVARLRSATAEDAGLRVLGWQETSPELHDAIVIDDVGDYIFHGILFAIVALAILTSILMSVLGRRREFGILQAMGLTRAQTGWVVFGEGLFLTFASGLVGVLVGMLFTWGFFRNGLDFSAFMENDMAFSGAIIDPVIVPEFHVRQIVLSLYSILLIGTLASIYPALRASRFDVAEAMKFDQ